MKVLVKQGSGGVNFHPLCEVPVKKGLRFLKKHKDVNNMIICVSQALLNAVIKLYFKTFAPPENLKRSCSSSSLKALRPAIGQNINLAFLCVN